MSKIRALPSGTLYQRDPKFGLGRSTVASVVNLVLPPTVGSLSYRTSVFVYKAVSAMHSVAQVVCGSWTCVYNFQSLLKVHSLLISYSIS